MLQCYTRDDRLVKSMCILYSWFQLVQFVPTNTILNYKASIYWYLHEAFLNVKNTGNCWTLATLCLSTPEFSLGPYFFPLQKIGSDKYHLTREVGYFSHQTIQILKEEVGLGWTKPKFWPNIPPAVPPGMAQRYVPQLDTFTVLNFQSFSHKCDFILQYDHLELSKSKSS